MRAIFDKAYYCPGDTIVLHIESSAENLFRVRFLKLTDCVFETITTKKNIEIVVPPNAFGGYGVDIEALDEHNEVVDKIHRGITVAKKWSDFPVYGYLTDFRPKRYDIEKTLNWLTQYHVSALQYYDWMYDYHKLVYEEGDLYKDAWWRKRYISNKILKELINTAHSKNIVSLAYVSIYAARKNVAIKHPNWAIYVHDKDKINLLDFSNKLCIMNTYKNSGWTKLLYEECKKVIEFGFDGIHLDQYGYPKDGEALALEEDTYKPYNTSRGFKEFINELKKFIEKPLIFNYVDNWPSELQNNLKTEIVYIEPWECCPTLKELSRATREARKRSNGKIPIIAGYINHNFTESILLTDATILSSTGQRLELGEYKRLLSGPYFPNDWGTVDKNLATHLLSYYDFFARYRDFFEGEFKLIKNAHEICENASTEPEANKIWISILNLKAKKACMINMVNYIGVEKLTWKKPLSQPEKLENICVSIPFELISFENPDFYFVSADNQLEPEQISVKLFQNRYEIKIPHLYYWSSILIISNKKEE
ncbi:MULTISPECIES: glycoside hydrolase family 66 protein [Pseudothermotoga]|jgi:dextranase|uniref:Uncharacterized protein n=2 Tax=Pseudothermotoga TaxID=1643951 RepID=A8F6K5_PSELT|nr:MULTISPECIES: glycoside hydrolase family 66 protein [Pseudothermotoga]ABV33789.1 hypothetical protein Tlet_1229 [Pseudothermotoga lettingae TMO]GLI49280.1 hypothetical protein PLETTINGATMO_14490 [Pseudothermotoga lettingae TMO]